MNFAGILASLLGGGLAGGCMSVFLTRVFHRRELRTKFYPKVSDMCSAYAVRMQSPEGGYWVTVVGNIPASEDQQFVDHRSSFISDLVEFNELREARLLRRCLLENQMRADHTPGVKIKLDLAPESQALVVCLQKLHKKLKI
jgi:hypothetical protein